MKWYRIKKIALTFNLDDNDINIKRNDGVDNSKNIENGDEKGRNSEDELNISKIDEEFRKGDCR